MSETAIALGGALLKALGVDASNVTSFTLHCEAGEIPTVTLNRVITAAVGEPAAQVMQQYTLSPKGEPVALNPLDESESLDGQSVTTHRIPLGVAITEASADRVAAALQFAQIAELRAIRKVLNAVASGAVPLTVERV
jgi:hypothetical protein